MADRLGLAVIPGTGWRASEIQTIAREAEEAGFDAIFAAEVNNDVMATAQLMGVAPSLRECEESLRDYGAFMKKRSMVLLRTLISSTFSEDFPNG